MVAGSITFTVSDSLEVQKVIMYDKPKTEPSHDTPILGIEDYSMFGGIICMILAATGVFGGYLSMRKKE